MHVNCPVSYRCPKTCSYRQFPDAFSELPPCLLPSCPSQMEPFPHWHFACCCSQHSGELRAVAACACLLPCPLWFMLPGQKPLHTAQMGSSERDASLPAVKVNGLELKQLLENPHVAGLGQSLFCKEFCKSRLSGWFVVSRTLAGVWIKMQSKLWLTERVSDFFPAVHYTP